MYKIQRTKQAQKGTEMCERAGFKAQLDKILDTVKKDPYALSQGFERLTGNLSGYCSRKINKGNRFVYEVFPNIQNARDKDGNLYDGIVHVYEIWGHKYKPKK